MLDHPPEDGARPRGFRKHTKIVFPNAPSILPAENHPSRQLTRLTYEAPGWTESGLGAFARALEHLHLGWAWIGWTLRLPVLRQALQWLTDLAGAGPRKLPEISHPE